MEEKIDTTYYAILFDDEQDYRNKAKLFFEEHGVTLVTVATVEEFLQLSKGFGIIICDYSLSNIDKSINGISIVKQIRKENKDAVIAIFSAFVGKISEKDKKELMELGIAIYKKQDPDITIKNLKRSYDKKGFPKTAAKVDIYDQHYQLNKGIVLSHMRNVSNRNINVPIIALNKMFTFVELEEQVINDTEIGNLFIVEFMESISLLKNSSK
jgi:CheY-like chemotaxis protein